MNRDYNDYWSNLTASHDHHPGNRFRYKLIADELSAAELRPETVLDCGCGDGSLLSVVARQIPSAELHGIDIADNVPISRTGLSIQFRAQDLGQPVPEEMHGVYDLVLCSEVIEHVERDQALLHNLADVTAQGGTVVLTTQAGKMYRTEQFLGHIRHYNPRDLCLRLEHAGLKVRKCYLAGWPWLNAQKIAAHYLQGMVQKNIVQAQTLSLRVRILFALLGAIYPLSSRRRGPQIVILATKL
ncbi:MAG: class I SAM-dependent methyltransferase [Acidobacteriaceae bacterium]|nr:class I SAM-dependent methyltransferase [Acidobacteriaceae bacterium]